MRTLPATILTLLLAAPALRAESHPRLLDKSQYADQLRAMWLAEAIANWTGRRTEGVRQNPPFLTDADWGTNNGSNGQLIDFVLFQNPWLADDDTDIEYVYVHLMHTLAHNQLTPQEIATGWTDHINRFIWVANAEARALITRGVLPPMTGSSTTNKFYPRIDAQLTTEVFGAVAPGMTSRTLTLADLPIRTVSSAYATHAAQFFAALYSEAVATDPASPMPERIMLAMERARAVIPNTSKSADIYDYVLTDFLDNPDINDWERTRDRIYVRYYARLPDAYHGFPSPASLGFKFRNWTASDVNFATALMALLYGEGDFKRTLQIATLSGWDSDNPTATMGALIGLMQGTAAINAAFPAVTLSDRFDIDRTRDNMPDYLPADPQAQDTFTLLANRMLPLVEREVIAAGGLVDAARILLPPPHTSSPTTQLDARSANVQLNRSASPPTASISPTGTPTVGTSDPSAFCSGAEHDSAGFEPQMSNNILRAYCSNEANALPAGSTHTIQVEYPAPVTAHTIRFIEGDHFPTAANPTTGGWFNSFTLELKIASTWTTSGSSWSATQSDSLDPARPFQIIDFLLDAPILIEGIRLSGISDSFVTCAEFDALAPIPPDPAPSFDLNADALLNPEDLYTFSASPTDLDDSGSTNPADHAYCRTAVRFTELTDTLN